MNSNTTQLQGKGEDVIIRQYRYPDDWTHIRQMFVDATMTGRDSPYQRGLAAYNVSPVVFSAIGSMAFLQIVFWLLSLRDDTARLIFWTQAGIGILCLAASINTWYQRRQVRRLFRIFIDEGLAGDLVDVVKSFKLRVTESGACIPIGPGGFWVAEIGGEFAGCVGLSGYQNALIKLYVLVLKQSQDQDPRDDATVGGVRRLCVVPTHQGKGVATKLMATLTSHARDHKLHALELTTSKYNQIALNFYQKLGWKMTGRMNYHGFALVVLRLELSVGSR
ncbi:hypothetical protein C0993_001423 [Termitomyces sp. T159_Od127]|nr:hypothetical protein C0993_001423 [Termitomyces sp. T159_Od127]